MEIDVLGPDETFIDTFNFFSGNVDPFRFHALADGEYHVRVHAVNGGKGLCQIRINLSGPEAVDRVGKARQYLDRYFHTLQGTQVAVIQKGELLLAEARGLANLEYNADMTLDTSVHEVLDGFPVYDPPIKVIHLMQGCSGLPNMRWLWQFATGVQHGWPTVEQASKRGFESWVQQRILDELPMEHTEIVAADTEVLWRAKIYGSDDFGGLERAWLVEDEITAFTTMSDWILWATFLTTKSTDGRSPWHGYWS